MTYDDMPAGREMDALVAEKVMGITWDVTRCRRCGWPLREKVEYGCVPGNCSFRPLPDPPLGDFIAPYSTYISAAWEVLGKFPRFDLSCYRGEIYCIDIDDDETLAPTAPLAICRAALKAVGKEK